LGGLSDQEAASIGPDKDHDQISLSQFIKGKSGLIDRVWITFVQNLFNGDDAEEKALYHDFIISAFDAFPSIRNAAEEKLKEKIDEIQSLNDETLYRGPEIQHEQRKVEEAIDCWNAIQTLFQGAQAARDLAILGWGTKLEELGNLTLSQAMTARMNAQLLNVEGILGGKLTKHPVGNETGEPPAVAKAGVGKQTAALAKTIDDLIDFPSDFRKTAGEGLAEGLGLSEKK
jgi:hypothetical protein